MHSSKDFPMMHFALFLLKYSQYIMLCYFQVYSKVIQLYMSLYIYNWIYMSMGFPGGASSKEPICQCRRHRHGFDPWVRKSPWKRAWWPTAVLLPGESQSLGSQRVGQDWSDLAGSQAHISYIYILSLHIFGLNSPPLTQWLHWLSLATPHSLAISSCKRYWKPNLHTSTNRPNCSSSAVLQAALKI